MTPPEDPAGHTLAGGPQDEACAGVPASAGVAEALALLELLPDVPVRGQVEVFDEVHRLLQDALATVDGA